MTHFSPSDNCSMRSPLSEVLHPKGHRSRIKFRPESLYFQQATNAASLSLHAEPRATVISLTQASNTFSC
jgi:hypothetical protein